MNELSLICRMIGNLFYRKPSDPLLAPLYESISSGRLMADWPLKQDELLKRWQGCKLAEIDSEYQRLFLNTTISNTTISNTAISNIQITDTFTEDEELKEEWQNIVTTSKMPVTAETQIYHYGFIWLLLSWLEAQQSAVIDAQDSQPDETQSEQIGLLDELINKVFFDHLKPISKSILSNLETYTQHDFYKVLAMITRELITAIDEEFSEELATSND